MSASQLDGEDRGATLVETAVASLVLFLLLFLVIETGYLFRDHQVASDGVGDATRVGALLGKAPDADRQIISTLRDATGTLDVGSIKRIVIFKGNSLAGAPASQVPLSCRNGTAVAGRCNVYNDPRAAYLAIQDGAAGFFCGEGTSPSPTAGCGWGPSQRNDGSNGLVIDSLGVWIEVDRSDLTKLFGQRRTLRQASVARIEVGDES